MCGTFTGLLTNRVDFRRGRRYSRKRIHVRHIHGVASKQGQSQNANLKFVHLAQTSAKSHSQIAARLLQEGEFEVKTHRVNIFNFRG